MYAPSDHAGRQIRSLAGRSLLVERGEIRVGQCDPGRDGVLFEMHDLRRAGKQQHHSAALQQLGQRDLARRRVQPTGDGIENRARPRKIAGRERIPRDEADAAALAISSTPSLLRLATLYKFCTVATGKTFVAAPISSTDASLSPVCRMTPSSGNRFTAANCSARGDVRIDAMQLPQVDLRGAVLLPAFVGLRDQIVRPAARRPLVWAAARQAALVAIRSPS
jgi:hypothetical protein